eukprot:TRINITY_DN21940_c0_g1_i1.p1 TRINITY_DN21940_c0_g1~~TRINITY_DN21940_c0_g1_i1.p1  ORF type:complete len:117 (-),score=18.38 TRINITY_DN21940_c0_g1_i1:15-365(-)
METEKETKITGNTVLEQEVQWMLETRPLFYDESQLMKDYGEQDAKEMISIFSSEPLSTFKSCLSWPGIGSRYKLFHQYLLNLGQNLPTSPNSAFLQFAQHLGRVTTFRALALQPEQ